MVHVIRKPSPTRRVLVGALHVLLRVVMVTFGSLSGIGSGGAKPALPPEVPLPPKEYRP
jgi:hypothetical protein